MSLPEIYPVLCKVSQSVTTGEEFPPCLHGGKLGDRYRDLSVKLVLTTYMWLSNDLFKKFLKIKKIIIPLTKTQDSNSHLQSAWRNKRSWWLMAPHLNGLVYSAPRVDLINFYDHLVPQYLHLGNGLREVPTLPDWCKNSMFMGECLTYAVCL